VEDTEQSVIVGIAQDILIALQHVLLVATEKVDLDAANTDALHPLHLGLTVCRIAHQATRTLRRVVPISVGVVPQVQAHTLGFAVGGKPFDALTTYLRVPKSIDEHGVVTQCGREIDVTLLLIKVATGVHADNPAPCAFAIDIFLRGGITLRHQVEGHRGLHDIGQIGTHGDGTPRRLARQGDARLYRSQAVALAGLRQSHGIESVFMAHEPAATVVSAHAGLRDQHPTVAAKPEQTGKGVALAPAVLTRTVVAGVVGLIARRGSCKPSHGLALRTKERGGALGQAKSRCLALDDVAPTVSDRIKPVAVSHVALGETEHDIDGVAFVVLEPAHGLGGIIVHFRLFDVSEFVVVFHLPLERGGHAETGRQVARRSHNTQR